MEYIVKIAAPRHAIDFCFKLIIFLLLCGELNHIRDVAMNGVAADSYVHNFTDASWTALPMCTLALLLIKHLNNLQLRLYRQATTDQLTELPNRRWFFDQFGGGLRVGAGLVLLDVDHFKRVNDTYGHDFGDESLIAIARFFRDYLPNKAHCARLGGEEFCIYFERMDEDARDVVQRFCEGTSLSLSDKSKITLTLSAGVYTAVHQTNLQDALRLTDAALYRAKTNGRAQFVVVKPQVAVQQSHPPGTAQAASA